MFGALSQGSTLYVLDKTGTEPKLNIATITARTEAPLQNQIWMQQLQSATVDITVSYADGTTTTFQRLPANGSFYAYEKAIVTETRDQMQQQVETSLRQSKSVIESVPILEKQVKSYEEILKSLSPTYAKEKQTDERLNNLEDSIKSMNMGINNLASIIEKFAVNAPTAQSKN